ncbi:MAG: hypothetical protein WAM07_14385 [Halobacillus sp.]|uniref:hypothetical protein n=1 Tax=Halobacillus sp. TaxID=56800 RepID=UPI003BAEBA0B
MNTLDIQLRYQVNYLYLAGIFEEDFELQISQGPEGDDEDSCGMNMIGKIPEGEA